MTRRPGTHGRPSPALLRQPVWRRILLRRQVPRRILGRFSAWRQFKDFCADSQPRERENSLVVPAKAGTQYSRVPRCKSNAHRKHSGILGRPVEPGDDRFVCDSVIRASFQAAVIAARKLLYVCGRFRALALLKREGGGSAERRVVNKPRLVFRIAGRQVHTATPLGAPPRRLKTPVRSSGNVATLGDFAPPACPRPAALAAEPRSGPGRKPEASRVRGATLAPRPQAPLPSPRSKASYRNAPSCGIGCLGIYT